MSIARIAVIAGNLRQFQQEAHARGFVLRRADNATGPDGASYRYVSSVEHVLGVDWTAVDQWGTWYEDEHKVALFRRLRNQGVPRQGMDPEQE